MGLRRKSLTPQISFDALPELPEIQQRRRLRRLKALFIPHLVRKAASDQRLADSFQDQAYQVALTWAELESQGRLPEWNETSIDTQFLDQLFGALGYRLKTANPRDYEMEHKFPVKGAGTADAVFGLFTPDSQKPKVAVELKHARADLDRDRFNGRSPVQQCWDYMNALPDCEWGIVSNFRSIRLYHKASGSQLFEEFTLQELRDRDFFNDFYCLFQRDGLLPSKSLQAPRAAELLVQTRERQKTVGDELYRFYQARRVELIEHLHLKLQKDLNESIRIAQKLLDRIIFIAFCEDRGLLPEHTLRDNPKRIRAYSRAKNPEWEAFLDLFTAVDQGANGQFEIHAYNGGLFAPDPAIDSLDLAESKWTDAFVRFGSYDFSEEVNVEVLGHLFERSITELEKLRVGGLFALTANVAHENDPKMTKSASRKRFGIYYTPPAFTSLIVERTLDVIVRERFDQLAREHGVDPESRDQADNPRLLAYWHACWQTLSELTVLDPACGSGAFLIRAYDALETHYRAVSNHLAGTGLPKPEAQALMDSASQLILTKNLYGVDLSREGVEITQLALWIRSARRGQTLADLSRNVVHGNSLVADANVDPHALDWPTRFPEVFARGGFDCVIGNPPWERVKVQEREFFALTDPKTASAVSAADRRKRIAAMPKANPALHEHYQGARQRAQLLLDYARQSQQFPLTGKGDLNLYMLFAEQAGKLVAQHGRVGLLVPSGIATDDTTKDFFDSLMQAKSLDCLYDFENRLKVFEDVDGRFKFSAIMYGGKEKSFDKTDFVFFAHSVEEVKENNKQRHIPLTARDMALLNPNTRTCPIFRTRRDADLTKAIYRRVPILIDHNRQQGGNPWEIKFTTMFHQTNDAEHFQPAAHWQKEGYKLRGNVFVKGKQRALPLYEAKMVQAYDHRAASVTIEEENWVRQGQKHVSSLVEHQNPEFTAQPRWWVEESRIDNFEPTKGYSYFLTYKDITSSTNERTMISAFIPRNAIVNTLPIVCTEQKSTLMNCLAANLNTYVYDYVARQKVGSVHLNFFIVEQLPTLLPEVYQEKRPWTKRQSLEAWISERVLKLSCTAEDMKPLAAACGFKGSRGDGVQIWNEAERATLRAELDAAYFHLYGLSRDEVEYVLGTFTNTGLREDDQQTFWQPGTPGARILELYDAYAEA